MLSVPLVTVIVTVFSPTTQVADDPLATSVSPFLITTVASLSVAVAVIVFVALVVEVSYSVTSLSNVGSSVRFPIVSAESVASGAGSTEKPPYR